LLLHGGDLFSQRFFLLLQALRGPNERGFSTHCLGRRFPQLQQLEIPAQLKLGRRFRETRICFVCICRRKLVPPSVSTFAQILEIFAHLRKMRLGSVQAQLPTFKNSLPQLGDAVISLTSQRGDALRPCNLGVGTCAAALHKPAGQHRPRQLLPSRLGSRNILLDGVPLLFQGPSALQGLIEFALVGRSLLERNLILGGKHLFDLLCPDLNVVDL
jgi:hypothetical protein